MLGTMPVFGVKCYTRKGQVVEFEYNPRYQFLQSPKHHFPGAAEAFQYLAYLVNEHGKNKKFGFERLLDFYVKAMDCIFARNYAAYRWAKNEKDKQIDAHFVQRCVKLVQDEIDGDMGFDLKASALFIPKVSINQYMIQVFLILYDLYGIFCRNGAMTF